MRATLVAAAALALLAGCGKHDRTAPAATVALGVRLDSIDGRVRVKRAEMDAWIDATLALTLGKGDLVSTTNGSSAMLRFHDGTVFEVRPGSLITIVDRSTDGSRRPHVAVAIESGEARFKTPASPGDRRFQAPGGQAIADPATEGNMLVAGGGRATVGVVAGRARVQGSTGPQVDVGPSQSVDVDPTGRAELSRTAPAPAPAPLALPPNTTSLWSGVPRPPQLAVDTVELKDRQLHLAGRTEPDVRLTVNGVPIPVQGDGSFSEHVVVVDATVISVRAAGPGGATTEQRSPIARR